MLEARTSVAHVVRGLLMGAADIVPGVSGGTVALIVGIYARLVRSVSDAASAGFRLLRLDIAGFRTHLALVDWRLVIPLGLGIVTALVIGSRIIPPLLDAYPSAVSAVFFGLILGSLAIPFRQIGGVGGRELAMIIAFAVGAFVIVGLPPREVVDPPLLLVFPAAAVAICAMILPGISGSFLLLIMGMYRPTLDALSGFDLPYILVFMAGAALGLAAFSKVLTWLLEHRQALTMSALLGLMAGSLRALWPWLDDDRGMLVPPDGASLLTALVLAAAGFAFVSAIAWLARPRTGGPHPATGQG
jgi:putative membrane protein